IYKEDGQTIAYSFPIIGKGLWSTLYGYFALEPDAKTVRGITFYSHGETPGLGAEIEKDWFTSNFVGKNIWDEEEHRLKPVEVVKGKVSDKYSGEEAEYYVDGISGATMTSKGVTAMIAKELKVYEPFFSKIRKN
ncbi:MAG: NADH:ubiquinone reductase (Na(+)-transporting) subunit C, partial [Candidatus Omnitrophica bacterium]|nr:NADH:ubiquinone reductase (Na(+)-transporting) subunit C [Candidatus Omnitrophota bacterium]